MSYKETLYFVATCLTISLEDKNRVVIQKQLQSNEIDWDAVVKVSTRHYVFPALYCNLKRVGFLQYLPQELVSYMKYITSLNKKRNQKIITQAKELNSLLLANNITPIFLKGTGNLLAGLYEDVAERMVGDIDFLFSEKDFPKVIKILKNDNYTGLHNNAYFRSKFRHYPRLIKDENIAAVEVHSDLLIDKYRHEFNYEIISKDTQKVNDFTVLSFENKVSLSMSAIQINDYNFKYKNISLRNAYDVFLLSKKVNVKNVLSKFKILKNPLNCFLASCYVVFGEIDSLLFVKTKESDLYLKAFNKSLLKKSIIKFNYKSIEINFKRKLVIVCQSFFDKEGRIWLFKKIKDKIYGS